MRFYGSIPPQVNADLFPFMERLFRVIGMASVGTSAEESRELGFLRPTDRVTLNPDAVLADAKAMALDIAGRPGTVHTKSSIMVGLGETREELSQTFADLREVDCDILTLGQYLQPSREHLPVERFVTPQEFDELRRLGEQMGFSNVASGPMVRSSYHADRQANPLLGD